MKRYCLALDLIDDSVLIKEYEEYHKDAWKEITASIKDAGIADMEIYRVGNRLFMIMETEDDFSLEKKKEMDSSNLKVQQWEQLMWKYQQALPTAKDGEKWILMNRIYKLPQ
ncbi:MAG: L-rhamnose mutarotase [Ginsengibacter sp.]